MTKNTLIAGLLAAGVLTLGSCAEDTPAGGRGHGKLAPDVVLDSSVLQPRQSRADSRAEAPQATDLSMRLVSVDGSYSREWNKLSDFDLNDTFETGDYTLEAWHGEADAEGFECPYYYGTTNVKVENNKTTVVSLTATQAQAMVSVSYTEAFRNYMTSWSAKVNDHAYAADETRPVYVTPGTVKVLVDFTKPNGVEGKAYEAASFRAKVRTHYKVSIDLEEGAGSARLVITYDDEMETVTEDIDISDEVMSAPAPEITPQGFTSGTAVDFVPGMGAVGDMKMNIVARGGLGAVTLVTTGKSLLDQGWPAEIDLMSATAEQRQLLTGLGLKVLGLWNNPDRMGVIDFSAVPEHIAEIENGDNSTAFTVSVRDRNSKTCEPVELKLNLEPLVLEITGADTLQPGEPLNITVAYNGDEITDKVAIEYNNIRGTWTRLSDVQVVASAARAVTDYTLRVNGLPGDVQSVKIRAVCGNKTSEFTVKSAPFEVAVNNDDVYASHAFVTVNGTEGQNQADLAAAAQYFVSADGGEYKASTGTADGVYFDITGLEPAKEYMVKVRIDGLFSRPVSFTTEACAQLPNSGMEEWSQTDSGTNWACVVAGSPWGTNNPMTTSQGGDFAYCRISGTISGEGHEGSGALIRTVGWGSGNTAVGDGGGSGKTKYTDAGLLHLGASRSARPDGYGNREGALTTDDLDCGIAFASRPSSLSFRYKYSPKNSEDNGLAEFWVKDAAGNVIASGTQNLAAAGSYTLVTIPMTYAGPGTSKAAKIYVKFLSTNDRRFLEKNNANFSGPGFGGDWGRGTYMGSQLYIDDITLNY